MLLPEVTAAPLCRLGGMGIINLVDFADSQFDTSVKVTALLKGLIIATPVIGCLSTRCPFYQS